MRLLTLGALATAVLTLGAGSASGYAITDGPRECIPTSGPDHFRGDQLDNSCDLRRGRDRLEGEQGNDLLWGGDGRDVVLGGKGDDHVRGGHGRDNLKGAAGNDLAADNGGRGDRDRLQGGAGDDRLAAQDGDAKDRLDGGAGTDICSGDGGDAFIDCEEVSVSSPRTAGGERR